MPISSGPRVAALASGLCAHVPFRAPTGGLRSQNSPGTLKGVRGFSDRSTVKLPGGASVFQQPTTTPGVSRYPRSLSQTPPQGSLSPETIAQTAAHAVGWPDQARQDVVCGVPVWYSPHLPGIADGFSSPGVIDRHMPAQS
jgi:hypothetical protein